MKLTSSAFDHNEEIPTLYTCEDKDISPPLKWEGAPEETKSYALIVDDPDAPDPAAPKMTYVHWVLYNIDPSTRHISEEGRAGVDGINDWKRTGYGGPCPPIGRHRYFFKLYALDCELPDLGHPTKPELLAAIEGHILAEATLIGTYEKIN